MSALAELAMHEGCVVYGSDIARNQFCIRLEKLGAKIFYGHSGNNLKVNPAMVIFSAAIKEDNIELKTAREMGIPIIPRSKFLGKIAKSYQNVVAISGMHGKTTVTAMIAKILMDFGNPTVHIGGDFETLGGNLKIGDKQYFVTEACEYADSFLGLYPTHAVVVNIEKEHMDYFKSVAHIKKSFSTFAARAGVCYINQKDASKIKCCNKKTFGINCGDLMAVNVTQKEGKYSFDCFKDNQKLGEIRLRTVGRYNVLNALAAAFVCLDLGVPFKIISKALFEFENVKRRFEKVGEINGNIIIHDYAHHPTEIKNAIETARETYNLPVVCVFQPHTFSRTKTLFKSFLKCFNGARELYILDTYSAREDYDYEGSAQKLCEELEKQNKVLSGQNKNHIAVYGAFDMDKFDIKRHFKKYKNCVMLFLGAGDVEKLAHRVVEEQ